MQEPLEQYLNKFDEWRSAVENLIEESVDLVELRDRAVELLSRADTLVTVRYLASPFISADDLKTLAEVSTLNPNRLRSDPAMASRIVETVLLGLDRQRFPWVSEDREPTEEERSIAIISTTALIASQAVQTARRTEAKGEQERQVAECLLEYGFVQVPTRQIGNVGDLPAPGEFCKETAFGSRKADLVIRLWDGRTMPLECKVSNSSTNSVKRLNNDAAVKARTWITEWGTANAVPAAVLSGVFKVANLRAAQSDGLTIFWAHALTEMVAFIDQTRMP